MFSLLRLKFDYNRTFYSLSNLGNFSSVFTVVVMEYNWNTVLSKVIVVWNSFLGTDKSTALSSATGTPTPTPNFWKPKSQRKQKPRTGTRTEIGTETGTNGPFCLNIHSASERELEIAPMVRQRIFLTLYTRARKHVKYALFRSLGLNFRNYAYCPSPRSSVDCAASSKPFPNASALQLYSTLVILNCV